MGDRWSKTSLLNCWIQYMYVVDSIKWQLIRAQGSILTAPWVIYMYNMTASNSGNFTMGISLSKLQNLRPNQSATQPVNAKLYE